MSNNFLNELCTIQESLSKELMTFRDTLIKEVGDDACNDLDLSVETYPSYYAFSYSIIARVSGEDSWSRYCHQRLCDEFGVELVDYRIKYTHSRDLLYSCNYFDYVYSPVSRTSRVLEYGDRLCRFGYAPQEPVNWFGRGERTRVSVHRLLVKLRELDGYGVDYERYVDKDLLIIVGEQLDYCLRNMDMGECVSDE